MAMVDYRSGSASASEGAAAAASASASEGAAGKVGIIYHTLLEKHIEIDVYLVDLDDSSSHSGGDIIHPLVKFRAHLPEYNQPALCVLNSSLYLFEGYDGLKPRWVPPPAIKTRTVYKSRYSLLDYHIRKHSQQQEEEKGEEEEEEEEEEGEEEEEKGEEEEERLGLLVIRPMNYPKGFPVALPTPDGERILIFATCFVFLESGEAFELYDPSTGFVSLPPLPIPHDHADEPGYVCPECTRLTHEWPRDFEDMINESDVEKVLSYCFIDESLFLIQMNFAVYTIDLNDLSRAWTVLAHDMFPLQAGGMGFYEDYRGYFETFGVRYALMPAKNHTNYYGYYGEDGAPEEEAALYVHYIGSDGFFRKDPHSLFFIEENPPKRLLLSSMNLPEIPHNSMDLVGDLEDRWKTGVSIVGGRKNGRVCNYAVELATGEDDANIVDQGIKDTYVVQHAQMMKDGRLVIDVCRTDFNSIPGVVTSTVSKSVSLTTSFSKQPDVVTCFRL